MVLPFGRTIRDQTKCSYCKVRGTVEEIVVEPLVAVTVT